MTLLRVLTKTFKLRHWLRANVGDFSVFETKSIGKFFKLWLLKGEPLSDVGV